MSNHHDNTQQQPTRGPIQHLALAYLHEHAVDPSHAMGSTDILLLVPLIEQRAAICLLLLCRHVLPRLHDGRHHLKNRTRKSCRLTVSGQTVGFLFDDYI